MFPYVAVLFIVYSWVSAEYKILNRKSIFFPLFILVLLATMRYYSVGTDSIIYTTYFRFPANNYTFQFNTEVETGYQYLVYMLQKLYSADYILYFCIVAILSVVPVLYTLMRKSLNYPLSLYIYITLGFYLTMYNQIRQCIAMGLCFFATKFLLEKKFFNYFLIIIIASQFHITALLMLAFYFLCHNRLRIEFKIIPILFCSAVIAPLIIARMALNNSRYEHYTEAASNGSNGLLTVILYVLIALFFYLFGRKLRKENEEYRIYECMYLCGVALLLPVAMLGTDPAGPQRIIQYFLHYVMLMFPIVLQKMNSRVVSFVFMLILFFYFILTIANNIGGIYPYKLNPVLNLF